MPPETQRDYEVGYGKPPRHTRFTKGQSGNPKGRPGGAKNLSTLLSEALNEPVIVTENGGHRKITKREAIIKQLVNQSAIADWRAVKILLDMVMNSCTACRCGARRVGKICRYHGLIMMLRQSRASLSARSWA
jgi:Family of unknown function (DUF5681)